MIFHILNGAHSKANIEKLWNKVGDARTGGEGSQRRKVKVVSKATVNILSFRQEMTKS